MGLLTLTAEFGLEVFALLTVEAADFLLSGEVVPSGLFHGRSEAIE